MEDLDLALDRLASGRPGGDLDGLEADVWLRVSQYEASRRRAASLKPVGAAGVLAAMILGVAAGGSVARTSPPEFEVFSSRAALAPSTLLGVAG